MAVLLAALCKIMLILLLPGKLQPRMTKRLRHEIDTGGTLVGEKVQIRVDKLCIFH